MRKVVLFSATCVTLVMLALGTYSASVEVANGAPPPSPWEVANGAPPPSPWEIANGAPPPSPWELA